MQEVDVAIVGGGPGGLAAALAVQRAAPNLSVRVFERAPRLLPVGYIVMTTPNGASALRALGEDVLQEFNDGLFMPQTASTTYIYMQMPQLDASGHAPEAPAPTSFKSDPLRQEARGVRWATLQSGLASFLRPGTLTLGHQLQSLQEDPSGSGRVLVHLHDRLAAESGSSSSVSVSAKVLIGADGSQSVVREHLLKDGPPQFLNTVIWRGVSDEAAAEWPHVDEPRTGTYLFDAPSGIGLLAGRAGDGKTLIWQVSAPWSPEELHRISRVYVQTADSSSAGAAQTPSSQQDKLSRCIAAFESSRACWPPFVLKMLRATPPEGLTEHGLFCREVATCQVWGRGRMTLLGDAAHLGTPALGQGSNLALEDAVELGRALARRGPCEEALREYEAVRVPRATAVQAGSVEIGKRRWLDKAIVDELAWHRENPWAMQHRVPPLAAVPAAVP